MGKATRHFDAPPNRLANVIWIAVIAVAAGPVWANPGAGVGIATGMHLVIGNAIIGIVEALVVVLFGGKWRAFVVLILANYLSAWFGWWVSAPLFDWFMSMAGGDPLEAIRPATWMTMATLIASGFLIEAPAFAMCFELPTEQWKRVVAAIVVGNTLTAIAVVWWYGMVTDHSLAGEFEFIDMPAEVAAEVSGDSPLVYFLSPDRRSVMSARLDGSEEMVRVRLDVTMDEFAIESVVRDDGGVDLAISAYGAAQDEFYRLVQESSSLSLGPDVTGDDDLRTLPVIENVGGPASVFDESPRFFSAAAELRPEGEREPRISFQVGVGISFGEVDGWGESNRIDLSSALYSDRFPMTVTVLPGDVLVFEISALYNGKTMGIYVASLRSRRIAKLADGVSPIVVYEE